MGILLGCIADDFTGATDLANTLVKQGMKTVQVIGIPHRHTRVGDAQAVVIALKSRSAAVSDAVDWSLEALAWLRSQGAKQYFFKYCSTFDSTDQGNIGPVADALLKALKSDFTVACPAFPANRRTLYKGILFVDDVPLAESGMKDHPLTPMRDSNLARLLGRQTDGAVGVIDYDVVKLGAPAISDAYLAQQSQGSRYAIVDALTDEDLINIGTASQGLALITGGSGIALGLPDNFRRCGQIGDRKPAEISHYRGGQAVLSGSCSIASRQQLGAIPDIWPQFVIDPLQLADAVDVVGAVLAWSKQQDINQPLVVSSSKDPQTLAQIQNQVGLRRAAELVEQTFGKIAQALVKRGFDRLIVAGGETSGSVINALGIEELNIGPEIDPGVPWCETMGTTKLAIALKSGNFGTEDFFEKAFRMLA